MRRVGVGPINPAARHMLQYLFDDLGYRAVAIERWSEIESGGQVPRRESSDRCIVQIRSQPKVSRDGFQNVLPWSRGMFVPNGDDFPCVQGFEDIGNDPILRPIPAPDHVSGPRGRDPEFGRVREERATVGGSD